jgi:pilus assembly protein CpaB
VTGTTDKVEVPHTYRSKYIADTGGLTSVTDHPAATSDQHPEKDAMKPKTMILAVVAIGCGLAASYMTSRLIAERNQQPEAEAKEKVLVAKTKIPAHTMFKEADLQKYFVEKELPVSAIPKKAIRNTSDLKDRRISRPLAEDSFVTVDDLVDAKNDGLAATLPPGMRAVAIRVNAESLAGGFVLPNSKVDVLSTIRVNDGSLTQTILQDMLVLAVDMKSSRSSDDAQAMLGTTVTLACWPEEAERLSAAANSGELRLTLRGVGDSEKKRLKGSRTGDIGKPLHVEETAGRDGPSEPTVTVGTTVPALPALPKDPQGTEEKVEPVRVEPDRKFHVMTIINGSQVEKARFPVGEHGEEKPSKP